MVCCFTRGVVLRQIKFHRAMWESIHVRCWRNLSSFKGIPLTSERFSNQYITATMKGATLFSHRLIPWSCQGIISYMHDACSSDTDSDTEEVDELLDPSANLEEKESIHDVLSPNSEDPIILRLKSAATVQEVLDSILENKASIRGLHLTHAILALWDLQVSTLHLSEKPYVNEALHISPESFVSHMVSFPDMKKFLQLVRDKIEDMDSDVLVCAVLYLGKLGFGEVIDSQIDCVKLVYEIIIELFNRCESQLGDFPLTALSRFMVATRVWNSSSPSVYNWTSSHENIKHVIVKHFQHCTNAEEFRLLTICLAHLRPSSDEAVLLNFKSLVDSLLSRGILGPSNLRPVVKAAAFLNLPHWSHLNIDLIRSLLLLLRGKIKDLKPADLILVNRVLQSQMEPANLLSEVQESASNLLQDNDHTVPVIDLLACLVHSVQPARKRRFEEVTFNFINNSLTPRLLPVTFKVLRHLKTSNMDLCNAFWSQTQKFIKAKPRLQEPHRLLRFCHWYMHFNNNLGGTYRHLDFETCITEILLCDLSKWQNSSWISRACAFVVAYGRTSHRPEVVIELTEKLFNIVPKLTADDCLIVSHGLHIAMSLGRTSRWKNKNFLWNWTQLARQLDRWSEKQLENGSLILRDLNVIARGYIERRAFQERSTVLSDNLVKHYEALVSGNTSGTQSSLNRTSMLSSRAVRDISANMLGGTWLLPKASDCLAEYVIQQGPYLSGETVERVLQNYFLLNHYPEAGDRFFETASEVLVRDKERIPGLSLLQATLGLCYFHSLPISLIHYIFAVDFLERLDDEIRHCYAKATYPVRVRYNLMELNRAVSLDYPQADIPWFHKKYCEEIVAMEPFRRSPLFRDVLASLLELLDGKIDYIQEKTYSPYFHKIDFLLVLDEYQNPLNPKHVTQKDLMEKKLTRIAVLLRDRDCYCNRLGSTKPHLRGLPLLYQRHLELLGYQVIAIPVHYWDSMHMASQEARYNYLKRNIFGGD